MVFISLNALPIALIVTFVLVAAELIAVSVLYIFLRFYETGVLQNGGSVSLPRHRGRLRYLALVLMLGFVGLEALFSFSSDTAFEKLSRKHKCVSLVPRSENVSKQEDSEAHTQEADVILSKCRTWNGTSSFQALGNFSLVSSNVSCSDTSLYSFNISQTVTKFLSNQKKECTERPIVGLKEFSPVCVFYDYVDGILFLSTTVHSDDDAETLEIEQEFLPTKLNYNASTSFIREVVRSVLQIYLSDVVMADDSALRRVSFTKIVQRECTFQVGTKEGTNVPVYVISIFSTIWVVLLLTLAWTVCLSRKRDLVNLSDPVFWIENYEGSFLSKNVKVEISREGKKLSASGTPVALLPTHEHTAEGPKA